MKKVLIVDDSEDVLKRLPEAFKRFYPDYEIHSALSFRIAEDFLNKNTYSIIMLDGSLGPRMTNPPEHGFGWNLIPIIKTSASKEAKIIMISGDVRMRGVGIELGADFSISKNDFFHEYSGCLIKSLDLNFNLVEVL